MSTMTLKMPKTYVDVDRNEMEYVDGGYYITNDNVKAIVFAVNASSALGVSGTVIALQAGIITVEAMVGAIPVIGWVVAPLIAINSGVFCWGLANAFFRGKGLEVYPELPFGLGTEVK